MREIRTLRSMSGDGKRNHGSTEMRRAHESAPRSNKVLTTTAPVRRASNWDVSSGSNGSCTIRRIFCSRIVAASLASRAGLAEQSVDDNGHNGSGGAQWRIRYLRARLLRRKALFYRAFRPGS